jgi:peptidoglycan/LPS O-acetylase OafA/YrhL
MLIKIYDDLDNAVSAVKISSFMYSVAIIIVLFFFRMNLKKNNVFVILGEMSFGIYFSHMFFVMISKSILYNFFENSVISNVFVQILLTILITLFSVIIGTILKRINNNFSSKYFGY